MLKRSDCQIRVKTDGNVPSAVIEIVHVPTGKALRSQYVFDQEREVKKLLKILERQIPKKKK